MPGVLPINVKGTLVHMEIMEHGPKDTPKMYFELSGDDAKLFMESGKTHKPETFSAAVSMITAAYYNGEKDQGRLLARCNR